MSTCVDASLALKWLAYEPGSDRAIAWLNAHAGEDIIAPTFLPVEVASVLRQKICRREMSAGEALHALKLLERLKIRLVWDWSLLERALSLAAELDQPTAYDTVYLALAEKEGAELWTADERFARAASEKYPRVRVV